MQESVWEHFLFRPEVLHVTRVFACFWENQSTCCSLRINGTMKVEFEDGEVSKGAARVSRKPFYTAPKSVASFIRCRSSRDVESRSCKGSCPPPPCLPLPYEISISCVCISFSVKKFGSLQFRWWQRFQQVKPRLPWKVNFLIGSQGGKQLVNILLKVWCFRTCASSGWPWPSVAFQRDCGLKIQ